MEKERFVLVEIKGKSNTLINKLVEDTKKKNKEAINQAIKFIDDNKNVRNA